MTNGKRTQEGQELQAGQRAAEGTRYYAEGAWQHTEGAWQHTEGAVELMTSATCRSTINGSRIKCRI